MSESRFAALMRLRDYGSCDVDWHWQNANCSPTMAPAKIFTPSVPDPVAALRARWLPWALRPLRSANLVLEKVAHVYRRAVLREKRVSDRQNHGTRDLACLDAPTQRQRVLGRGREIENSGEARSGE